VHGGLKMAKKKLKKGKKLKKTKTLRRALNGGTTN
jgi:hypothetical protein